MTTAAQILNAKPDPAVYTTTPDASVFEAVREMARRNVGALVVMEGEAVVGIVTERDYARKIVLLARASRDTEVQDIMTAPVMYVQPTQTVDECMALMTDKRLRHLPVMDDEELLGVISIGDLVKQVITDQKHVIEQLEHYIRGQPA
jgi:CBS domain-containing protein